MNCETAKSVSYTRLYTVAGISLVLDIITKSLIIHYVPKSYWGHSPIQVIPGFFDIVHVHNEGAAWGIFSGYGIWLGILGAVAIVAIFKFRKDLELHKPQMQIAFGMLIGGIAGNVIDRILYGHVIDFIDIYHNDYHWPAFNIADSSITLGVACYIIITIMDAKNSAKSETCNTTDS